jgi:RNA polymerase sigma factor (sigma-70 family)
MATGQMTKVIEQLRHLALRADGERTDGQLLESFLSQGEQGAFEALVQRHGRMVLGVCRRLLQHAQDAEDAFQVTFLVLVRQAAALRSRRTIGDWLYGVAYHTALKARAAVLKRRAKERESVARRQQQTRQEIWQELQPLLDDELRRLPEKYRVAIVLCDLEGKTRKEAAQQLGWPEGTVSGRLARARALLGQRLSRQGLRLSGGALAALLGQQAGPAAVPAALVVATTQAATMIAAGQGIATGVISAQVAALMEGVLKAMLITKLKLTLGVMLAVGVVGTGTGVLALQSAAVGQTAQRQVESLVQAASREEQGQREQPRSEGDRRGPSLLPPGIERLDLDETQKEKLAKIKNEFEGKLETAKKKFAENLDRARQNQDRQQAEQAQQAFRQEVNQLQEQVRAQLQQALTEAQQRRLAEMQRGQPGGRPGFEILPLLRSLDLSAEQREKLEKLAKELTEKQDAAQIKTREAVEKAKENQDRDKLRELLDAHQREMAKLHDELRANLEQLLTEEQRQRLGELLRQRDNANAGGRGLVQLLSPPVQERLGLTAEQREKIARLQKEMEGRLREILTEEQNRQVEQLRRGEMPGDRPRPKE